MVAAAVIGGGVLSAGASMFGSSSAANAQEDAANKAAQTQLQMYNQTRSDLLPYMDQGRNAFTALGNLMGMGGPGASANMLAGLRNYPGYQWALEQGNQGLDRTAAAKGLLLSGGQLKDAMGYNQGMADQLFGTYYNQMAGMAQLGENAAAQTGNAGTAAAQAAGSGYMAAGNAAAGGAMGMANAAQGLIGNSLQAYQMLSGPSSSSFLDPVSVTPDINGMYAASYSDRRLKENIRRVGKLDSGFPVYSFNYKGSKLPTLGVMAQDVEKRAPHLVTRDSRGYRKVNYWGLSKLPPFKEAA